MKYIGAIMAIGYTSSSKLKSARQGQDAGAPRAAGHTREDKRDIFTPGLIGHRDERLGRRKRKTTGDALKESSAAVSF
jgi:hypothetical protein